MFLKATHEAHESIRVRCYRGNTTFCLMVGRVVSVRTLGTRNAVCRCNLGGRVTPINLTFLIQVVLHVLYVVFIKYDKVCELSKHLWTPRAHLWTPL